MLSTKREQNVDEAKKSEAEGKTKITLCRAKSNYAPKAEIDVSIQHAAFFIAAAQPATPLADALGRRVAAQAVLRGLDRLRARGIVTRPSRRAATFAPRLLVGQGLAADPEAAGATFAVAELEAAMLTLVDEGRLVADVPVRPRSRGRWAYGLGRPEWAADAERLDGTDGL